MDDRVGKPLIVGAGAGTGSTRTVLVVVRGPSGAGKSSTAARIRSAHGRGLAVATDCRISPGRAGAALPGRDAVAGRLMTIGKIATA